MQEMRLIKRDNIFYTGYFFNNVKVREDIVDYEVLYKCEAFNQQLPEMTDEYYNFHQYWLKTSNEQKEDYYSKQEFKRKIGDF